MHEHTLVSPNTKNAVFFNNIVMNAFVHLNGRMTLRFFQYSDRQKATVATNNTSHTDRKKPKILLVIEKTVFASISQFHFFYHRINTTEV